MILLKLCRNIIIRLFVSLVIISSLVVPPAHSQETEDSQVFIAGFNSYQQKDYASSIEKLNEVLQKYPDTPLRDMALFWLSRSYFKAGNQQEAARYLSQFSKEYPDNPLKSTVEDELLSLVSRYEKGEKLSVGTPPAKQPDRLAAQKAKDEKERIAAVKAEEAKQAAAAAESARIAALKQKEDNAAAEKKELERLASIIAEQEKIAMEMAAREKSEATALTKRAEEKSTAERMELERLASAKDEQAKTAQETAAREKTEQQKAASIKLQEARKLAEEVEQEQERLAVAKAEAEQAQRVATKSEEAKRASESARLASLKQAEEKAAAEKAERERIAQIKAEEASRAEIASELARLASIKAEEERKTAERTAKDVDNRRLAVIKAEEARLADQSLSDKNRTTKLAYREKAIGQYKDILEKFPSSAAAITAAAKLRKLGVAVALPTQMAEPPLQENAQILRLEVAQFAGFEFNLLTHPEAFTVGRQVTVPFEVINRGNGNDSFILDSAFPANFNARFASAASENVAITQTPDLAPGDRFKGLITLTIPPESIDGLRITHPVKVVSRLIAEASQSREVRMVASAPLLRAVLRTEKTKPLPGDKIVYRVAVLNVGSTVAQDVTFRLNFPPQLEPVDYASAGFRQEMKSSLVFDGLQVNSGESREFSIAFQLKDDSMAGQELLARAELVNNPLKTTASFVSNTVYVEPQHGISVRTASERLLAIPGQTISVPFIVTNTGNVREKFRITSVVTGAKDAVIFNDLNRDGIRQASEPVISEIGPLAPREEASVVVEIKTPKAAEDNSRGNIKVAFVSEGDSNRSASGSTQLTYSRPVLKLLMSGRDGRLKPGDVASFDLTINNNGSNLARVVELQSAWPEQLELLASDPASSSASNGAIIWRFKEVGAGEKRSIKVSFRVKPGIGVGTAIQVKNVLTYEDQLGNRY